MPIYQTTSYVFEDTNHAAELFALTREPVICQAFLKEVSAGDKRIILVDGEFAGAINRIPGEGEIRSNLAAGGRAEASELTETESEICAALGPELKRRGLLDARGGEGGGAGGRRDRGRRGSGPDDGQS